MSTKDGGPAFPTIAESVHLPHSGMSLRDWFAGMAMNGEVSNSESGLFSAGFITFQEMAEDSYRIADAMLTARKEEPMSDTPRTDAENTGELRTMSGLDKSLTPETDAMMETDAHRIEVYSAPRTAYIRMCELARTLERERDEWRKKAVELHADPKPAPATSATP
jgi:hypothetical protein